KQRLVEDLFAAIDAARDELELEPNDRLYANVARASRWDPPEIVFIKRTLQTVLPPPVRARIADELFRRYVSSDEQAFAGELYMTSDQLRMLVRHGMYVGCHGYAHVRLGDVSAEEQALEIDRSLEFLASVGTSSEHWIMCYPYGDANEPLTRMLRSRGCALGLPTR